LKLRLNTVANKIIQNNWQVTVPKNVSDILTEHGVSLESINSIIWSHYHWDHTGDPSLFPPTTSLTVGPGFTKSKTPGYPTNPNALILESAYKGRELVEISFEDGPSLFLGRFRALDYFGDGSFYLLDSPGHAVGHICGLARTTPDTFLFMGGDIFADLDGKQAYDNPPEAQRSLGKLEEFDGYPNILTIIAHDQTLLDVLDFYPKNLNDWQAKGYKERGMWQFLRDFREALKLE
ncbi:hypothetical protein FRC06_010784, partial [Ceratobasidium sp. 370]